MKSQGKVQIFHNLLQDLFNLHPSDYVCMVHLLDVVELDYDDNNNKLHFCAKNFFFLVFFYFAVIEKGFSSTIVNESIEISAFNIRDKYAI